MEMIISNTIQPVNLFYAYNLITERTAYIFVNTECNGVPYQDAVARGDAALSLFRDVLEYKNVQVFTNLDKQQIIEKLDEL